MAHEKIWNFDDPLNFDFNASVIEFGVDFASKKLIDLINQSFVQNFDNGDDFVYDVGFIEFVAGTMGQKSLVPANALDFFPFTNDANSAWGINTVGALTGGAAIVDGKVDLTGHTTKQFSHPTVNNYQLFGNSGQVGALKFDMYPDWLTGNPSVAETILVASGAGNKNAIFISAKTSGELLIDMRDEDAISFNFESSVVSWVKGQKNVIELNKDSNGISRLFLNGNIIGSIDTSAANFSNLFKGDALWAIDGNGNQFIDNIIWFDSIQHTANHALETVPSEYVYGATKVEAPQLAYSGLGNLQAFTAFASTASDQTQFILNDLWYNGGWGASDGTFSQSNTKAQVMANIATLPASDTLDIDLSFDNNNTNRGEIDDMAITYTGQDYSQDADAIEPSEGQLCDGIEELSADVTTPSGSSIKFYVKRGTEELYWDGSDWVTTDKTESQLNTLAEIFANRAGLDLNPVPHIVKVIPELISDGVANPSIKSITMKYNYYKNLVLPNECKISGYLMGLDIHGVPDGTPVRFYNKKPFRSGENALFILDRIALTTTKNNRKGWFEIYIVETETIEKTVNSIISWTNSQGEEKTKEYKNLIIPDKADEDFNTLIGDSA